MKKAILRKRNCVFGMGLCLCLFWTLTGCADTQPDENVESFLQGNAKDHGIYFQFLEDSIIVTHDSDVRMWFGGGGIATAEGTYIEGSSYNSEASGFYTNSKDTEMPDITIYEMN